MVTTTNAGRTNNTTLLSDPYEKRALQVQRRTKRMNIGVFIDIHPASIRVSVFDPNLHGAKVYLDKAQILRATVDSLDESTEGGVGVDYD